MFMTNHPSTLETGNPVSFLAQERAEWQATFEAQPFLIQRFLDAQANHLAEAILQRASQVRFTLPDRVILKSKKAETIPAEQREQIAGGLFDRLARTDLDAVLGQLLFELEASHHAGVVTAAGLLRYATVTYMVHQMLPSGRSVQYRALEGEEIPTIPIHHAQEMASALTEETDAIVEESERGADEKRGELMAPYVPAARRFYLPQWVAFDEEDHLLVNSSVEAEAHIASMQQYLKILHAAVSLAPYLVSDPVYQQKRYGMLGQLVNQGRALARFQTCEMIEIIQRRAADRDLNRGLSVSLPYFDDQTLQMRTLDFEIIPAGRIMFVPAFVVRAARQEEVKVAQDTRLNPSTRRHLLAELQLVEQVFVTTGK